METGESDGGRRLREIRERLGLKYRDVQEATQVIAQQRGIQHFALGLSRLADIENRGTVPSIYRLYSLSAVYGMRVKTLLGWYGINLDKLPFDTAGINHRRTRFIEVDRTDKLAGGDVAVPEPSRPRRTTPLSRYLPDGGTVPIALASLEPDLRYALVGTEEWGMYPLVHPGAYVQVDEKRARPEGGPWASEAGRPIYLVEERDGYRCAWCTLKGRELTLQFHPCSGLEPVCLITPAEAEVVGQVVGVAMRLISEKRRRIRS